MITTKTADKLANRAMELMAISDAVYEVDRDIADAIHRAASNCAHAGAALRARLEQYAAAAVKSDDVARLPGFDAATTLGLAK